MALLRRALAMALLFALAPMAWAEKKPYDTGPAPAWVETVTPDLAAVAPPGQVAKGVHYLLSDQQVRVDGAERVSYRHVASKALDAQGVEAIANLEVRFDPSYQRLTLHAINVRRGTLTIAKLGGASVKLLQRETDLEALVYDGSVTANVFLEDVRVGDVVEYAYSVRGQNPVFGAKQFGRFEMRWSVPIARVHARLLWPLGRELQLLRLNDAAAPTVQDGATHRDHRWDSRDVAALRVENDAPAWFDPYPSVQWGEFGGWQSVARWAVPLYRLPAQTAPKVQAEIRRIAGQYGTADQRLLAALRFVQREVRYLGVEVGAGSHAPSAPEVVLGRRFGDCKDKTLLTIALLRGLGIEAQPALVNTVQRRAIRRWQPSPAAFNHVIVRARLNGDDLWIDPTRAPQQGELAQLVQADYGPALVVDDRSDALVPMAGDKALFQQREMRSVLDSRDGFDKPVKFTVTTVAVGAAADAMRATLTSQGREALQRQYVNFYARSYPGTEVAAPFDVVDDGPANRLTVTEHYAIKSFWQRSEKNKRLESSIEAPDLIELLRQPRSQVRDSPLSLNHPIDVTSVTEVMLPGRWAGTDDSVRVDDPAFELERSEHWKGATLLLTDRYRSRLDHIEAGDVARYTASLEKARQGLNYTLFSGGAPATAAAAREPGAPHWVAAVVGTLAVIGFGALALRVYRWDPAPPPPGAMRYPAAPNGLGGWLIFAAIGIVASMLRVGQTLWGNWPSYATGTWLALTTAGAPAYHPLWAPALVFELAANLGLLIAYALLALLFFTRRSSVPRVFIALTAATVGIALLDAVLIAMIPAAAKNVTAKDAVELARTGIVAALWIAYFLRSERVRTTFVRTLETRPVPAPTMPAWAEPDAAAAGRS